MRVYDSFDDFDHAERRRRGLHEVEPDPTKQLIISRTRAREVFQIPCVTVAALRAEGVVEVGRAAGTSVLFVRTRVKIHLIHATSLPDRALDAYAVQLAVTWIDGHGLPGHEVAQNLGVNEATLRKELASAGYERTLAWRYPARKSRGRGGRGNRGGGKLRHSSDAAWQVP